MKEPTATWSPTRPDVLLRGEALLELVLCVAVYRWIAPHRWGWFALLFLVPDVSLVPYAFGQVRAGAAFYNALHSSVLPLVLGLAAWWTHATAVVGLALIWLAHIAFDRCVGYGLKYPTVFKPTHIERAATL